MSRIESHFDALHSSSDAELLARRDLEDAIVSGDAEKIAAAATKIASAEKVEGTLPTLSDLCGTFSENGKLTATEKSQAVARILVDGGFARGVNGDVKMGFFKVERDVPRDVLVGAERLYAALFTA